MQVLGSWCFACLGIFGDFALESPVVGETGTASVFAAEGPLRIVQLQFGFEAPMNPAGSGGVQLTLISLEC